MASTHSVATGIPAEFDFLLIVSAESMEQYHAFTREAFSSTHTVRNFKSMFAMNCSKFETRVPLQASRCGFPSFFIELGALRVIEGWGDDIPDGKVTDFRRAVQATAEETVAFSWVEWPDKATRDTGMKKRMEDPRMDPSTLGNPPMPFDGFEPVVEVKA